MGYSPLCTAIIPVPDNHHSGPSDKASIRQHDIECPPGKGWARALASSYMQNPATQASIHYIVDAGDIVGTLDEIYWAWGSGSPSSQHGLHIEQAGYASFSRAQWLGDKSAIGTTYIRPSGQVVTYTAQDAADMAAQMELLAKLRADICTRYGWQPEEATDEQIRLECNGVNTGKHYTHRRATDIVGGTTHRDPGSEYPIDVLNSKTKGYMGNQPTPTPEEDWLDMATKEEVQALVAQAIKDATPAIVNAVWSYKETFTSGGKERTLSIHDAIGETRQYIDQVPERTAALVNKGAK